jgi:hypothetical protein
VDHQCGFRCNRSTTDQIFFIRQILGKKWEYNEIVHQPFWFSITFTNIIISFLYSSEILLYVSVIWMMLINSCSRMLVYIFLISNEHILVLQWMFVCFRLYTGCISNIRLKLLPVQQRALYTKRRSSNRCSYLINPSRNIYPIPRT